MKRERTILLLDGSLSLVILARKTLEQAGYNVCSAMGCSETRELLKGMTPDAILLGKELTDGDGIAFCRELSEHNNIPILLLSGDGKDELPALQAGASGFMRKPYDCNILIARIDAIVDRGTAVFQRADDQNGEQCEIKHKTIMSLSEQQRHLSEAANQSKADSRTTTDKYLTIKFAVYFLLIAMGVAILSLLGNSLGSVNIIDEPRPLAALPLFFEDDAQPYSESEHEGLNLEVSDVSIPANTAELDIHMLNPADNPYSVVFEIELADGESLYVSGLVKPGMCIDRITLSKELEKGEYDAVLIMCCYTEEGIAEGDVNRTAIHITAD